MFGGSNTPQPPVYETVQQQADPILTNMGEIEEQGSKYKVDPALVKRSQAKKTGVETLATNLLNGDTSGLVTGI